MDRRGAVDVLIVSLGSTAGLRQADAQLQASLERSGASVAVAHAQAPARVRTLMLTDLLWARAARAAARSALAGLDVPPGAIVYSSTTASLLWPRPGAIRFDAPSAANRRGRHGLWQRPLERLRLRQAPLLLPWSEGGREELPAVGGAADRTVVLPVAVEPSARTEAPTAEAGSGSHTDRDIAAITYAANPSKKGLDRVLEAWRRVRTSRPPEDELVVVGAAAEDLASAGMVVEGEPGVRVMGALPPRDYRALLRRARVFVCAPRREDYGLAQLEALADGCQLVTTPAPGPYAALTIARTLDRRLVQEDLALALRTALEDPLAGYAAEALQALAAFAPEELDRLVAERLLPRLLG
jgi:glycosyltransferase involved in cell wall biosynthesis